MSCNSCQEALQYGSTCTITSFSPHSLTSLQNALHGLQFSLGLLLWEFYMGCASIHYCSAGSSVAAWGDLLH